MYSVSFIEQRIVTQEHCKLCLIPVVGRGGACFFFVDLEGMKDKEVVK